MELQSQAPRTSGKCLLDVRGGGRQVYGALRAIVGVTVPDTNFDEWFVVSGVYDTAIIAWCCAATLTVSQSATPKGDDRAPLHHNAASAMLTS